MSSVSEGQGRIYSTRRRVVVFGNALVAGLLLLPLIAIRAAQKTEPQHTTPVYSELYAFTGGTDGGNPWAALISDAEGNLYGTTQYGGDNGCYGGCGVVFKLDGAGTESVLYAFTGGQDGATPYAGLIRDAAGNLYGTTKNGGNDGLGVVFELDPSGIETVLHSFTGGTDGGLPVAGLVRDPAGNFYGSTTYDGGCAGTCGSIFKLDSTAQHYSVLYRFTGHADGGAPGDLIVDPKGNIYGTTFYGGHMGPSCSFGFSGCGVVFKLDPAGHETVLHTFSGRADGANPNAGLIRDAVGNLYGATLFGGNMSNSCPNSTLGCGVVFKLDPSGNETVLHTFSGGADGANPYASLLRDRGGSLYGTTFFGGNTSSSCPNASSGCGVVFKLDTSGTETVLYSFAGGPDGSSPIAGLLAYKSSFYGTAYIGANIGCIPPYYGCGVVFRLH